MRLWLAVALVAALAWRVSAQTSTSPCFGGVKQFTTGLDGYVQSKTDDFDWTRRSGTTTSGGTGPTSGYGGSGFYLYTEASSPRRSGDTAVIMSPSMNVPRSSGCQLSFYYNMYGAAMGTMMVNVTDSSGVNRNVWSASGNKGAVWLSTAVTLNPTIFKGITFKVLFIGIIGSSFTSDMAIDQVSFSGSCCTFATKPCGLETVTFSNGLRGWTQSKADQFDWTVDSAGTSSSSTGPATDITPNALASYGKGSYLYIETSSPRRLGDTAIFNSPNFDAPDTPKSCQFNFWYHSYGATVGSLFVNITTVSGTRTYFSRSNVNVNRWEYASIPLLAITSSFQISIIGVRGSSFTGDIAVDQLYFTGCCAVQPCVARPITFDKSGDGFYRSPITGTPGATKWFRDNAGTTSSSTGPSTDHTFGNSTGYYWYLETSSSNTAATDRLISPVYKPTRTTTCSVKFWYHMYGSTIGSLNVYIVPSTYKVTSAKALVGLSGTGTLPKNWVKSGNQGNKWIQATVSVTLKTSFYLIFDAVRGTSFTGDIAIDDVSFDSNCCPDWSKQSSAAILSSFAPGTQVVRGRDWSWGQQDGGQGALGNVTTAVSGGFLQVKWSNADSNSYRMGGSSKFDLYLFNDAGVTVPSVSACTMDSGFESSVSPWIQSKTDKRDWTRDSGGTTSSSTGPGTDHTKGTSAGYYMYLETSSPVATGDTAVLQTPILSQVKQDCSFTLWYHMYGTTIGTLSISITEIASSKVTKLFSKTGNQGNRWIKTPALAIKKINGQFQISIQATRGTSFTGDIAIDDVAFDASCCAAVCIPKITYGTTTGNLGGWANDPTDKLDWRAQKGSTSSGSTGPTADHTGAGYYIYVETSSPASLGDKARLISPPILPPSSTGCTFTFWYHMYGSTIGKLELELVSSLLRVPASSLWTKSGNQGTAWLQATVTIKQSAWINSLQFIVTRGSSFTGDISLDDLSFGTGCGCYACTNQYTFESNSVAPLVQSTSDTLNWRVNRGGTPSTATGPSTDHTLGTALGYYIYIETSGVASGANAIISLPPAGPAKGPQCAVVFWYHMYGSTVNTLNVRQGTSTTSPIIWQMKGNKGNTWYRGVARLGSSVSTSTFKVAFEAIAGTSFTSDIALDDIWLTPDCCSSRPIWSQYTTAQITSSFRQGTRVIRGAHWSWGNQGNNTAGTITQGLGNYSSTGWVQVRWDDGHLNSYRMGASSKYDLYLQIPQQGAVAPPTTQPPSPTPTTPPVNGYCYPWASYTVAQLTLIFSVGTRVTEGVDWSWGPQHGGTNGTIIATLGQTTTGWVRVTWDNGHTNSYRMGASGKYDLCLESNATVTTEPPFAPTACGYSNNFDIGMMNFTQDKLDVFDWTRRRGSTSSSSTGPSGDHTTGTGYYLYIETSSPRTNGDVARLYSPFFTSQTTSCSLSFWYNMYGATVNTLNVNIQSGGKIRKAWSKSGNQGNKWISTGPIPISYSGVFRVIIEGVAGSSFTGDIAIDDFQFSTTCCATASCGAPIATFNSGLDGFSQETGDHFDWTRRAGNTPSFGTGPTTGHGGNGSYIYIETSFPRTGGDIAIITSGVYSIAENGCEYGFWYHMSGTTTGTLNIVVTIAGTTTNFTIWSRSGDQGNSWQFGKARLPARLVGQTVQVSFVGIVGSSFTGDIAVDDAGFQDGCCRVVKACGFTTVDFQSGLEGFTQDATDNYQWARRSGGTPSFQTGPSWDHTYANSTGYYVYLETSGVVTGRNARLVSRPISSKTKVCSFNFWYHMYGATVNTFNVYLNQSGIMKLAWTKKGNQGNIWRRATVFVNQSAEFNIVFEAITGSSFTGDIALDDITFNQDCCGTYCSELYAPYNAFQMSIIFAQHTRVGRGANWKYGSQDGGWGFQGTITKAPPKSSFGPVTVQWDNGGSFSYQVGFSGQFDLCRSVPLPDYSGYAAAEIAQIMYENITVFRGRDWKWANQDGMDTGLVTVNMSLHNNIGWVRVFFPAASGNQENSYRMGAESAYDLFRVCDVDFSKPCKGTFKPTTPPTLAPTVPTPTGIDMCASPSQNFESGFGGYTQDPADQFDWIRQNGGTSSLSTGPSRDHTTNSSAGFYVYIETSAPRSVGDIANLWSPWYKAPTQTCSFSFWYHMFGSTIGDLNVTIITGSGRIAAWTKSGNQGDTWHQATIPMLTSYGTFRLIFTASRGGSFTGDIALDDLSFGKDCCRGCNNGPITFETGLQAYTQSTTDDFDWTRRTGSTPSFSTGPSTDHTLGTAVGGYMYIETSFPRSNGDVAVLVSPKYSAPPGFTCSFQFFYSMYGATIGNLSVWIRSSTSSGSTDALVWSMAGNKGQGWKAATVAVPYGTPAYQILFRAVAGSSFTGDIAIDDISFTGGCCSSCNGPSTFETGLGIWSQPTSDDFDWTRKRGSTTSSSTGPPKDHTPGIPSSTGGFYMYTEASSPRTVGDKAYLQSPAFSAPLEVGCQMQFWYHMYGATQGELSIIIRHDTVRNYSAFSVSGNQGTAWQKGVVAIPIQTFSKDVQILIEGTIGTSFTSDIAIDDISFTSQCCPADCLTPNNFENSISPYILGPGGDFNWTRSSGSTGSFGTGPTSDHTVGNTLGRYLYIETSFPRKSGDKAYFTSPVFVGSASSCSVQWWYHMYGTTIGSLQVSVLSAGKSVATWTKSGNQGNAWKSDSLAIPKSAGAFQVQWLATCGSSFTGDIAIDDISFSRQCCSQTPNLPVYSSTPLTILQAKFKNGTLVVRGADWSWGTQDVGVVGSVVQPLGVSGTVRVQWGDGSVYTYSMGSGGKYELYSLADLGGLVSGGTTPDKVYDTSKCPRYSLYSKPQLVALFKTGTRVVRGQNWQWGSQDGGAGRPGTITVGYTSLFTLVSVVWDSDNTTTYRYRIDGTTFDLCRVDDIVNGPATIWPPATTTPGLVCPDYTTLSAAQVAYAFSNNTAVVRGKDWSYGSQDGGGPGVTVSHVLGGLVSVQWTANKNTNTYRLGSSGKFDLCRVADVGKTTIVIILPTTQAPSVCGNPVTYEIGWQGYTNMAGDDFDWSRASGSTASFSTGPTTDHTFGNSRGYYAYIETSFPRVQGDTARLQSPLYPAPPTKHCQMSFWYHMYGTTTGSLLVYVVQPGKADVLTFNRTGEVGNYWVQAFVNVSKIVTGNYQLKFVGIAGSSFTGDIAIDDVFQGAGCCSSSLPNYGSIAPFWAQLAALFPVGTRVVRGRDWVWGAQDGGPGGEGTVTRTVTAGTQTVQVLWDNGNSFSYRMGNGKYDLYRIQDLYSGIAPTVPATTLPPVRPATQACTKLKNFEQDLNGFQQSTTDTFDWTRQQGPTSSFNTGPDVDHTLMTRAGYYVYIETSFPRVQGDFATLLSPWYASPPTNHCRINFYYHMHGASVGSLNVTVRTRNATSIHRRLAFYKAGDNADKWEFGSFSVPAHSPAFQLEFTGVSGNSFDGDLALDDISLSDGCCQGHPDYSTYPSVSIGKLFAVGTRVVRGKDWSWGDQDKHQLGTITGALTSGGWVKVTWDYGYVGNYRMGYNGLYDLWLAIITGCEDLATPTNGLKTGTSSLFGAKANFSCNTGYFLQGSEMRTCQTSGSWTGSQAICLNSLPTFSQYSPAELAAIFTVGTRVIRGVDWSWGLQDGNGPGTVETALNFTTGMLMVKWDANGQTYAYRMGPPTKKYDLILYTAKTCPVLAAPAYGQISSSAVVFGTTVMYTCNAGYTLQGPATRTCYSPGVWDGLVPMCLLRCNSTQYQCAGGLCVSSTARCNQIPFECPDNSDEAGCPSGPAAVNCSSSQFACASGTECIASAKRCDGYYWDCGDGSDEAACTSQPVVGTLPDYTGDNGTVLAAKFPVGARVVRGKDWIYGFQDGFSTGTITSGLSGGFVTVQWDVTGATFTYRMGAGGSYDLYLVSDLPTTHCRALTIPAHGYKSVGSDYRQFGSLATFGCRPGYLLQGAPHTLCLGDGSWTSVEPTCAPHANGSVGIDFSLLTDDEVESLFTSGVRVVRGRDWIYGNQDGGVGGVGTVSTALRFGSVGVRWDSNPTRQFFYRMGFFQDKFDLTLFMATRCVSLYKPLNGYMQTSSVNFTVKSTVVFGCYAPYSVQGSSVLTCQANGVWQGVTPICTQSIPQCSLGEVRCLQSSTCYPRSAECDGIFNCPDQSDEIYCGNGTTAAGCPGLDAPKNGYIAKNSTSIGATIIYQCYDPYVYQGVVRRTCGLNGTWDGQVGQCSLPFKQCLYYEKRCADGATCIDKTKVCNNYPDCPDASDEIGCTAANITTPAPGQLCSPLSSPPNGYIQGNATDKFGYVAFGCNAPYVLQGSSVRRCQDDGTWSGFPAFCTLNSPQCASGYLACLTTQACYKAADQCDNINDCTDGSDELHCNITAKGCPKITAPVHGYIQGASTSSGAILVFGCTTPYQLQGPLTIQCRSGVWDQGPPKCIHPTTCTATTTVKCLNQAGCVLPSQICDGVADCTDGSDEATCPSAGTGSACAPLVAPANGKLQGTSRGYSANVIVSCKAPYTLQGSSVRVCQINRQWSGSDGICKTYVQGCQPNQIMCYDGTECIAASAKCDGKFFDCVDHSDEADCPTSPKIFTVPTTAPTDAITSEKFNIITLSDGSTKLVPITPAPSRCFVGYCFHGGTCVDNGLDQSIMCNCPADATGSRCQQYTGETTTAAGGGGLGTGPGAEQQSTTTSDSQLYYILIGVMGGVLLLIVVLVAAYVLMTSRSSGQPRRPRPVQPNSGGLQIQDDGFRGEAFALGDDQELGMSNPMYDTAGAMDGYGAGAGDQLGQSELAGDPLYEPVPAMQLQT